MNENKVKVTIMDYIDDEHKSHYWYGGQCAKIEYKGYIFSIEAIGDVYCDYVKDGRVLEYIKDKNNAGVFYNEMNYHLKNDNELYEAIDKEELIFDHNNWWECFVIDPSGEFHDLMWDLDSSYLDEAIEEVKERLDETIKYIKEG